MAETKSPEQTNKKRPGRPRKLVNSPTINFSGIVDKPSNEENILELLYYSPTLFKKILLLMRQFEASELVFEFGKEKLNIKSSDRIGKSIINVSVAGNKMNHYYCKDPIIVCVTRSNLEKVLKILNKYHDKITFVLREIDFRSTMYIIVHDSQYNSDNVFQVGVICETQQSLYKIEPQSFSLSFSISMGHFRNMINNARNIGVSLTIQKTKSTPLQLTTLNTQKVTWTSVYPNNDLLSLKHTLDDDDILSVSVDIEHIKPIANSNIGNNIIISCGNSSKISLNININSDIGTACEIEILTDIREIALK